MGTSNFVTLFKLFEQIEKKKHKCNILEIKSIWAVAFGLKISNLEFLRVPSQYTIIRLGI